MYTELLSVKETFNHGINLDLLNSYVRVYIYIHIYICMYAHTSYVCIICLPHDDLLAQQCKNNTDFIKQDFAICGLMTLSPLLYLLVLDIS